MLKVFFNWQGIMHVIPEGAAVNKEVLICLLEEIYQLCPQMKVVKVLVLLCDSAPAPTILPVS
jgi:diacylglycerol kinase